MQAKAAKAGKKCSTIVRVRTRLPQVSVSVSVGLPSPSPTETSMCRVDSDNVRRNARQGREKGKEGQVPWTPHCLGGQWTPGNTAPLANQR